MARATVGRDHDRTRERLLFTRRAWALVVAVAIVTAAAAGFLAAVHAIPTANAIPATGTQRATAATEDFAVQPGFRLDVDTQGFALPTALAFVPQPGPDPDDPLYFVTELHGRIKVVSNDRNVRTFATVDAFKGTDREDEAGLAGICLDPPSGSVIVTFTYLDQGGILRNNLVRFTSTPGTFDAPPTGQVSFREVFAPFRAAVSHQVGGCQVHDGSVFVGVGDGNDPRTSADLDQLLGKVLCFTLDAGPCSANPFALESAARRYVYASGFRNPFGLQVVDGQVYVAENGVQFDRFVRVEPGANYNWDGTDGSIGANAEYVFVPAVAPAQLEYVPQGSRIFPEGTGDRFVIAASAPVPPSGPTGIVALGYDTGQQRVSEPHEFLVRYRGPSDEHLPVVAALAAGPDGLYFASLYPPDGGAVLRLSHDADREHEHIIGREGAAGALIEKYGCLSCHVRDGQGRDVGPPLDASTLENRLALRLAGDSYKTQVARVDKLDSEPFVSFSDERRELLRTETGPEQRHLWIRNRLLEPRFDDPNAKMPTLGMTEEEADTLASFLLHQPETEAGPSLLDRVRANARSLLIMGTGAFALGVAVAVGIGRLRRTTGDRG